MEATILVVWTESIKRIISIVMISIANIRKLDLNLLLVFHCLLTERSVTKAAAFLHVTQGAVSSALKRLREQLGDDLFVRTGAGMVPTRRALEYAPKIREALTAVSAITGKPPFSAVETSRRIFNIALSDDIESFLAPQLVADVRKRGLEVSFAFHQTTSSLWKTSLGDNDIDLAVCAEPKELTSKFSTQVLFSSSYSCLYDGPRLNLSSPITRDEYLLHDHVRISFDGRRGFVDDIMDKEGVPRRVCASFTHFAGLLPSLVSGSAIATLPTFAAHVYARVARLTVSPVPIHVPAFRVFMVWPVGKDSDAGNQWLRSFIVDNVRQLGPALPSVDPSHAAKSPRGNAAQSGKRNKGSKQG